MFVGSLLLLLIHEKRRSRRAPHDRDAIDARTAELTSRRRRRAALRRPGWRNPYSAGFIAAVGGALLAVHGGFGFVVVASGILVVALVCLGAMVYATAQLT